MQIHDSREKKGTTFKASLCRAESDLRLELFTSVIPCGHEALDKKHWYCWNNMAHDHEKRI